MCSRTTSGQEYDLSCERKVKIINGVSTRWCGKHTFLSDNEPVTLVDKLISLDPSMTIPGALSKIIRIVYECTYFKGCWYDGVLYRELPNLWDNRDEFADENEDEIECNASMTDYFGCPMESIERIESDDSIDFDISWVHPDHEMIWDSVLDSNTDVYAFFIDLLSYLDQRILTGKLILCNPAGRNKDHRGSDHCLVKLPFETKTLLINPTIRQLADAIYLLKSHKFDRWYELFCGTEVKKCVNGSYIAKLDFDHGS